MESSTKFLFTISFCLAFLVVHRTFGQLLVLKNLKDPEKVDLTCISKDDNAALVWNYNPKNLPPIGNFSPMATLSKDINMCAVRDDPTLCSAEWNERDSWEMVNTTMRPMGPVFDYRWEGLKEYVLNTKSDQYVGRIPASAGSIVFSARGSNNVHVLLCKSVKPKNASCVWISLPASGGKSSTIKSCGKGKPESDEPNDCESIGESIKKGTEPEINLYEWRTYIVKWAKHTISVYRADEIEPFMNETMQRMLGEVHVSVKSDQDSRVRFHFYDYFKTEKKNAVISTNIFVQTTTIFCVELLLGLCSNCKLNVSLMDLHRPLEMWTIPSGENTGYNELLSWRSVRLEKELNITRDKPVQVTVKAVLDDDEDRGQWAIGNFRTCTRIDKIRQSTVTISPPQGNEQPMIKCQKLSYNKPELVNTTQKADKRDSDKFEIYMRENEKELKDVKLFDQYYSVCDDKGCLCDRGFSGDNCGKNCGNGHYGYNCLDECTNCTGKLCNGTNGYCTDICTTTKLFPPDCKIEITDPIVTEVTDTKVKIYHIVQVEHVRNVNVSFILTKVMLNERSTLPQPNKTANGYELELNDLRPNTYYEVHTEVEIVGKYPPWVISSKKTFFATTCNGMARFEVLPGEHTLTIYNLTRDKICGDPDYDLEEYYAIEVVGIGGQTERINTFPFVFRNLTSYSEYRVDIRKDMTHEPVIFSTRVRTIESAPSKPRELMTVPRSHGSVKLTWQPSISSQAEIQKFVIIVDLNDTKLLDPPKEKTWVFTHTVSEKLPKYSHMLSLPPSSSYVIFVSAMTENNVTSKNSTATLTLPPSVGFDKKEKLEVTQSGTIIKTKYPSIINATHNTTVSILVGGVSMCDDIDEETGSPAGYVTDWRVVKYNEKDRPEGILSIGANQNTSRNCSLYIGFEYKITAVVGDSGMVENTTLGTITLTSVNLWLWLWLILVPILATCLYLTYRLRRKNYARRSCHDILPMTMTNTGTSSPPPSVSVSATETEMETENPIYESVPDVVQNNLYSNVVKVEDFEEYTKEAMASGLLNSQHAVFSIGPPKPCKYGRLTKNLTKNRFPNVIPYDESRVVLKKLPGDSQSDYINASYIQGYHKTRAYIASQGPKAETVKDFWRMIWQEKVRVICMVANVMESGEAACEQYWPEVKGTVKYGDIQITNTNHQVFADYTVRTLNLSCDTEWRSVTQLHYTGWPDNGVPMHTQSLVAYMKKLLAIPAGKGPIVVHCSAGVGRTGTIILCDYCLRQAVKEKVIDVPSVGVKLSEDRENLMGNVQLYLLAHLTIVEAMVAAQTQIPCNSGLPDKIKELKKQLPSDVRRLKGIVWQDRALHSLATHRGSTLDNGTGHRPTSAEFVPESPIVPQFHRDSTFDSESNYISAVSVDGVMMRKQYLESHLPSNDTLCEYWRLIAEKRIELVVILQSPSPNDSSRCGIMPTDSTLIPVPYIKVQIASKPEESEHYITEKLMMTDKSGKKRKQLVTVITCTGWGCGKSGKPPPPAALVAIWRATEKIKRKEGPTLVICYDGVTGCGLYLALSFLLERMSIETVCDVISAVRAVRRSRTEFVPSMAQFEYLYDAAVNYYECFQTYANFA